MMPGNSRLSYETRFGGPPESWSKEELLEAVNELLGPRAQRRGRPRSASLITSATTNHKALAFWVRERIGSAREEGKKLSIKKAVKQEMIDSVERRNQFLSEHPQELGKR